MTDVLFYHLTETPLEHALPPLLERSLDRGWRARIFGGDPQRLAFLADHLWSYADDSFLPHGMLGAGGEADQPILLGDAFGNENAADVLFLIDQAKPELESYKEFERVCVFFDGTNDVALSDARGLWKALKDSDLACKYWAQEDGRWVQKSST